MRKNSKENTKLVNEVSRYFGQLDCPKYRENSFSSCVFSLLFLLIIVFILSTLKQQDLVFGRFNICFNVNISCLKEDCDKVEPQLIRHQKEQTNVSVQCRDVRVKVAINYNFPIFPTRRFFLKTPEDVSGPTSYFMCRPTEIELQFVLKPKQ